jgi:hypothetical protein
MSLATSNGPGSGRRNTRAVLRRSASHSAPAMWPPSSGSSGSMFSRNSDRFSPASSEISVASLSTSGALAAKTSPPTRATPTMPTGWSALRGAPSKAESHSAGIFEGRVTTDLTLEDASPPILSMVAPKPRPTVGSCGTMPRNPALTVLSVGLPPESSP